MFGQQLDAPGLQALLENADGSAHPQALVVLHQLVSQPAAMQPCWPAGRYRVAAQPWRSGTEADWTQSPMGLPLSDVPYYLAQPEERGAVDPVLVTATAERGGARCSSSARPRPWWAACSALLACKSAQGAACAGGHGGATTTPRAATSALRS
ncbi:MAG: hypothetical protein U1E57_08800 [Paenacidovorax caeni]